jgi:hypothetical protein
VLCVIDRYDKLLISYGRRHLPGGGESDLLVRALVIDRYVGVSRRMVARDRPIGVKDL